MKIYVLAFSVLFFSRAFMLNAQTVKDGDDLETVIKKASAGDVIIVESGTYNALELDSLQFERNNPLIIRAKPGANVVVDAKRSKNRALYLSHSRYLVFEGIHFKKSLYEGILIEQSDHIIINECHVSQSGQAGIKVALRSDHVDILKTKIHDTGKNGPSDRRYGEGIYVGRGGNHNSDNWPDLTKHVWIEGCEIYTCGAGEGIDIKGGTFFNTIRGNVVRNITLGDPDYPQTNEGAISLGHYARWNGEVYKENIRRENWVENNTIEYVRAGKDNRIAGIYSAGLGNNIKNNQIKNVRTTSVNRNQNAHGIKLNDWDSANLPIYVHNNSNVAVEDGNDYGNLAIKENPGANPNKRQDWYPIDQIGY